MKDSKPVSYREEAARVAIAIALANEPNYSWQMSQQGQLIRIQQCRYLMYSELNETLRVTAVLLPTIDRFQRGR